MRSRNSIVGSFYLFFSLVLALLFDIHDSRAELSIVTSDAYVKRTILALYDGSQHPEIRYTPTHKFAEMPLNHLGYQLVYFDVRDRLPAIDKLGQYAGILTWFDSPLKDGQRYITWAEKAGDSGVKFFVFGDLGVKEDPATLGSINRFLRHLGLRFAGEFVAETSDTHVTAINKQMVGFERPVYALLPAYNIFVVEGLDTKVHLGVSSRSHFGVAQAVLIATGPGGGFVQHSYSLNYEAGIERYNWLLDPYAFFDASLGNERFPIPDVTTVSGRRLYFSHVDGDGWNNVSLIENYRREHMTSSRVMLKELIKPYPDLPVTVGLITGDFDATIGGDPGAADTAREIFALSQVEVGSHTHTHPFNWQFYETYDREAEQLYIEENTTKLKTRDDGMLNGLAGLLKKQSPRERHRNYIAGSGPTMPRAYMRHPFDLRQEIAMSLKLAESYAPAGKKAMLMQWSGDTITFDAALGATRAAGVRNINGGDMRFDAKWPSIAYVPPIARSVGAQRQIYAAASNENTYTNDWTGPYYGFRYLDESLKNTETPRRLKPFNLYYHTYSAERDASLRAVKSHLERARHGPYAPVAASHYAAIADSFFDVKIKKVAVNSWTIHERGDIQTLRFDQAQNINIDWLNSTGVLGATRHETSLYIALDAAVSAPRVTIYEKSEDRVSSSSEPLRPVLQEARWRIKGLNYDTCNTSFQAQGFGAGEMQWSGFRPGRYEVKASAGGRTVWNESVKVGKDHKLRVKIETDAIEPLEIRFNCRLATRLKTNQEAR